MKTLYINNLKDSIKISELQSGLYLLFGSHGKILNIIISKKCRGQAWIVYMEEEDAIKAMASLNGFPFYGKLLKVTFAKEETLSRTVRTTVTTTVRTTVI